MRLHLLIAVAALAVFGCRDVILNAPPTATISVSANPTTIDENGGTSLIQAIVRLDTGEAVPDGVNVGFFTTLGTIDAQATTRGGIAEATLRADGTTGVATVSAVSGAAPVGTVDVIVGSTAETVVVSFDPPSLPDGGGTTTVTARLLAADGQPLSGRLLTLTTSAGALASGGMPLETNASGAVTDTLVTTVTTTVTATVERTGLTGQGTVSVLAVNVGAIGLNAAPGALGDCGGDTTITATVTDTSGAALSGAVVSFFASAGALSSATAVTSGSGLASVRLTTTLTSIITASVGSAVASITVTVGDPDALARRILLEIDRLTVNDTNLPGAGACQAGGANSQLPITVDAVLTDRGGGTVNGVKVTLTIEDIDDATDAADGKGGFCASSGQATATCPGCGGTCPATRSSKTITATTGGAGAGRARFTLTYEDPDFCACASISCTTRITACAADALALNELRIDFSP